MENVLIGVAVFCAGILVGAVLSSISSRRLDPGKHRTELTNARERILAGLKQNHEKEIMREIFRATDALNGELDHSLRLLTKSMEKLLVEVREKRLEQDCDKDARGKRPLRPSTSSA